MYHESIKRTFNNFDFARDFESPYAAINFKEDEWEFDYIHHSSEESKTLLVLLPAALNKDNRSVPNFTRWSWGSQFKGCDTLSASDPTLRLNDRILGGWYQGKSGDWLIPRLCQHISDLQKTFGYENIIFCGSSLGGFAALQLAVVGEFYKINCRNLYAYAENPQISLLRYQWKGHMDALAQASFDKKTIQDVDKEYEYRLDIVELINRFGVTPKGMIAIKESDTHHLEDHVKYFEENFCLHDLNVIKTSAEIDDTGHTAYHPTKMREHINSILEMNQ